MKITLQIEDFIRGFITIWYPSPPSLPFSILPPLLFLPSPLPPPLPLPPPPILNSKAMKIPSVETAVDKEW